MGAELPNRQSIRLKGWDYATPGHHFVTVNARESRALFGVVVKGRVAPEGAGARPMLWPAGRGRWEGRR